MLCRQVKLNIKLLSNEIVDLNVFRHEQERINKEEKVKLDAVLANQELLFCLVKRLADCFQLEYMDGKYVSKRKPAKNKEK